MTIFNLIPAISMPSGTELIIILVIVLLLFGGKKIPELMRGLGKGVKSFKQGMQEAKDEINKIDEDESTYKGKKD
jgi:sec-independent protein translocase protein TatA